MRGGRRALAVTAVCVALAVCPCLAGGSGADGAPSAEEDLALGYQAFSPSPNQNHTEAARRFLRAAKAGSQGAQALAGYSYLHGLGMPKNAFWAVYWLQQALAHPQITEEERAMAEAWLREAQAAQAAR